MEIQNQARVDDHRLPGYFGVGAISADRIYFSYGDLVVVVIVVVVAALILGVGIPSCGLF